MRYSRVGRAVQPIRSVAVPFSIETTANQSASLVGSVSAGYSAASGTPSPSSSWPPPDSLVRLPAQRYSQASGMPSPSLSAPGSRAPVRTWAWTLERPIQPTFAPQA